MEKDPVYLVSGSSDEESLELAYAKMASISTLCRTCLNESYTYSAIYEDRLVNGSPVYKILNDLFQLGVNINDGFPEYLCQGCYMKITDFKKFETHAHAVKCKLEFMREGKGNTPNESSYSIEGGVSWNSGDARTDRNVGDATNPSRSEKGEWLDFIPLGSGPSKDNNETQGEYGCMDKMDGDSSDSEDNNETQGEYGCMDKMDGDSSDSEVQCLTEIADNASSAVKSISGHTRDIEFTSQSNQGIKSCHQSGKSNSNSKILRKCQLCCKFFGKNSKLNQHLKIVHKLVFACDQCGLQFKDDCVLVKHWSKSDCVKSSKSKCQVIKKQFPSSKKSNKDRKSNRNEMRCICHVCKMTFSSKRQMEKHMLSHPKDPTFHMTLRSKEEVFQCDICAEIFFSHTNFEEHKLRHAYIKFSCVVCRTNFSCKKELENHQCIYPPGHTNNSSAESLAASISGSSGMKSHEMAHNGKNASNLDKNGLNISSSSHHELPNIRQSDLNQHGPDIRGSAFSGSLQHENNNITPTDISVQTFDINEAGFSHGLHHEDLNIAHTGIHLYNPDIRRPGLNNSLPLETHNEDYTCPSLDNGDVTELGLSNSSSDKRRNITNEVVHPYYPDFIDASSTLKENSIDPQVGPRFRCETCGEKFYIHANLVHHMKGHAGLSLFDSRLSGPISCRSSTKQKNKRKQKDKKKQKSKSFRKKRNVEECYSNRENLNNNISHRIEPSYSCNVCRKKFSSNPRLEDHKKSHEKRKRIKKRAFSCNICGTRHGNNFILTEHLKVHDLTKESNLKDSKRSLGKKKKAVSCHICETKFVNSLLLTEHLKVHDLTEENNSKSVSCQRSHASWFASLYKCSYTRILGE